MTKAEMQSARAKLSALLERSSLTAGMYVRLRGDSLVAGREEACGPDQEAVAEDRVRLTRLSSTRYGLSVKRHTGRWERTPFSGSMDEVVEAIWTFMQHLVAPY